MGVALDVIYLAHRAGSPVSQRLTSIRQFSRDRIELRAMVDQGAGLPISEQLTVMNWLLGYGFERSAMASHVR